ncbi:unnamed protein product [Oikopleura dioica]|uniref:Uncharacterized protein n=1 Tax=Oikopleura dioica TaxID=34765 RepID=E4Y7A7_OIKDI|nr:unnamed protein product [Oikopleura dioica]
MGAVKKHDRLVKKYLKKTGRFKTLKELEKSIDKKQKKDERKPIKLSFVIQKAPEKAKVEKAQAISEKKPQTKVRKEPEEKKTVSIPDNFIKLAKKFGLPEEHFEFFYTNRESFQWESKDKTDIHCTAVGCKHTVKASPQCLVDHMITAHNYRDILCDKTDCSFIAYSQKNLTFHTIGFHGHGRRPAEFANHTCPYSTCKANEKKKIAMSIINRFTNILQNAVEALAPQASSIEEFTFHWKRITNYYIESADEKEPVSRTNIPAHLQQMLDILIAEELELIEEFGSAENQTGPCLEHLLHQNILETLTTFGRGDTPPGMKQQVLHFATTLLGKIKQPLLPHVNVHKPVIKLVAICGEVMAAPTEKEEVHFLCVVCSKIKLDPYQVNFFVQTPTLPNIKRKSPNAIEQIAEELDDISTKESELVDVDVKALEIDTEAGTGLLNLTKSPDQKIAVKACEGLMLLVGLPEAKASKTLVECTQLANFICCKLSKLISELPLTLDPADVESTEAKWGLDSYSAKEDKQAFTGKRQLRSFLSFLDFIDTLIEESHRVIGSTLAKAIKLRFRQSTERPASPYERKI